MGTLSLPNPGIKLWSPALQVDSSPAEPQGKPKNTAVGSLTLSPTDLPDPEIELGSPALQADSLPTELPGKSCKSISSVIKHWPSQKACWHQESSRCWGDEDLSEGPFLSGPVVFPSRHWTPCGKPGPGGVSRPCLRWIGSRDERGSLTPRGTLRIHVGRSWVIALPNVNASFFEPVSD